MSASAPATSSESASPVTADDYCYVEAMIYYRVKELELAETLQRKDGIDAGALGFAAGIAARDAEELEDLRAWYLSWADARPLEPPADGPCGGHGADHAQMPGMPSWSTLQGFVDAAAPRRRTAVRRDPARPERRHGGPGRPDPRRRPASGRRRVGRAGARAVRKPTRPRCRASSTRCPEVHSRCIAQTSDRCDPRHPSGFRAWLPLSLDRSTRPPQEGESFQPPVEVRLTCGSGVCARGDRRIPGALPRLPTVTDAAGRGIRHLPARQRRRLLRVATATVASPVAERAERSERAAPPRGARRRGVRRQRGARSRSTGSPLRPGGRRRRGSARPGTRGRS